MTLSRRDRWLGRYGLVTLNLTAGAIAAHSRDRVARLLGAATLSTGGGANAILLIGQHITLNGQSITLTRAG